MVDYKLVNGETVPLSDEEQAALDAEREAYDSPEAKQSRLLSALAARRYEVETGGIEVGGMTVLTDDRSKLMINGAMAAATQDAQFTTRWKTPGGFVTLTAAQIIGVANAVAAHVRACFEAEAEVAANIAGYGSEQEVVDAFDLAMTA